MQQASRRGCARYFSSCETPGVIGCGSNVVDRFFRVKALPKPGEKGFFANPTKIQEGLVVGGVTLNHLAWASALGVSTALLARQGDDEAGRAIRKSMDEHLISQVFLDVTTNNCSAESYVFLDPEGERSIIMASGSTSTIDGATACRLWKRAFSPAPRLFSTEISQVPLSGVKALLEMANNAGAITVLDIDVSPSVAMKEAGLGTYDELLECVRLAKVIKPAKHAAAELISMHRGEYFSETDGTALADALLKLKEDAGARDAMVALTQGKDGCVVAMQGQRMVTLPANPIGEIVDATGAGDAFLGGLLAGIFHMSPWEPGADVPSRLVDIATLANATAATNCRTLGGLPPPSAPSAMYAINPDTKRIVESFGHA